MNKKEFASIFDYIIIITNSLIWFIFGFVCGR